jgi:predicted ester cyclase
MPPTGKKIDIGSFDELRMEGERAAEHWGTADELKLMKQLGLVPEDPPA